MEASQVHWWLVHVSDVYSPFFSVEFAWEPHSNHNTLTQLSMCRLMYIAGALGQMQMMDCKLVLLKKSGNNYLQQIFRSMECRYV